MTPSSKIPHNDNVPVKKFTGKKFLVWIVGFFLVIFAVNGIMAYIALGTWGGLETNDAYRKGLDYNQEIASAESQKNSGWKILLKHSPKSSVGDRLDISITYPSTDLPPAKVTARIFRAVTDAYDQEITLTKTGADIYTAPVALPLSGQWNLVILVKRPDGPIYQLREKIFIPAPK